MSIGFIKNGSVVKINSPRINSDVIKLPDNVSTELVTKNFSGTKNIDLYDKENIRSYFLYKVTSPGLNKIVGKKVTSVADYAMSECYINDLELGTEATVSSATLTIGANAFINSIFKKVTLPENTDIGNNAFKLDYVANSNMKSLTEINTENIKSVGSYAFYNQRGISSLDLSNLTSMGSYAFANSDKFADATQPSLTSVILDKLTLIPDYGFFYQKNLSSITWGDVTNIGQYAFRYTALQSISNSNITTIGQNAFSNCVNLTSINLPNLTTVSTSTFEQCSSLASVQLASVTSMSSRALGYTSSLKYVYAPNLTSLGYQIFIQSSIEFLDLPNVASVGEETFRYSGLKEAILPALTKFSDKSSFFGCRSLKKVDIGPSFTRFNQERTFGQCSSLEALILRKNDAIVTLSKPSIFNESKIAAGTGYIYVPRVLVDSYKVGTNWSTYADQFRAIEDYPTICSDTSIEVSTYTEGDILNDGTFTTSGTTRLVSNFIELPIDATTVKLSISNNNDNNNFFIAFYDENQNPHLYNTYNLSAKTDWSDQIDTEMYLPFGAKYIRVGLEYNANYVSSPPVINISYGAYEYIYESLDLSDSTLWENGTTDAQGNPSESSVRLRTIVNYDADKIRNAYLFGKMYDTVNTSPQIDYDLYNDSSTWISYIDYHNIWSRTPGFVPITPLEDSATHLNAKIILKYTDDRTMSSSDVEIIKYYQKSDSSIPMWFEI
jgi:hypothetical protein